MFQVGAMGIKAEVRKQQRELADVGLGASGNRVTYFIAWSGRSIPITDIMFHKNSCLHQGSKTKRLSL
jgi:hypothetical protein